MHFCGQTVLERRIFPMRCDPIISEIFIYKCVHITVVDVVWCWNICLRACFAYSFSDLKSRVGRVLLKVAKPGDAGGGGIYLMDGWMLVFLHWGRWEFLSMRPYFCEDACCRRDRNIKHFSLYCGHFGWTLRTKFSRFYSLLYCKLQLLFFLNDRYIDFSTCIYLF